MAPKRPGQKGSLASASAAPNAKPAREWIGSAWGTEKRKPYAAFSKWTALYLAASAADRAGLVAEGVSLAQSRRQALATEIKTNPQQALADAVPMTVRSQLPQEIADQLESHVSGQGNLALEGTMAPPGGTTDSPTFRSAVVNGTEYRAYTYGRREDQATKVDISVIGVAVDHDLAVSESPLRVLEPGETPLPDTPVSAVCPISGLTSAAPANTPLNVQAPTAVEVAGKVQVLCHVEHVSAYENRLINAENAAGPYSGALSEQLTQADGSPGTSGVVGRPPVSWSTGTKKILIIRVDFSDLQGTPVYPFSPHNPIDANYVNGVFNNASQVADFYAQGSYGLTAISIGTSDVTGVLRMPQTAAYYAVGDGTNAYNSTLHTDAEALASGAGFNLANYDRIGVVFSNLGNLTGSHITYGGLGDVQGNRFWINGFFDFRDCAHEIGHTYGLQHCNLWQVNDGNPVSPNGTSIEYGDPFGVMSSGNTDINYQFDMWQKSLLHWIPDTGVTTISAAGTYRVYRFDHPSVNTANPLALKIVRNSTQDYWIGLRQLFTSNSSLMNGAYILWGYNTVVQGNLLDMTTPGTNAQDAALAVGASFHDTVGGVTIHPLAKGGTTPNEYLDVQVSFDPHIQWQATTYNVDEQSGSVTLTLNRSASSTGAVSVNYATSDGTATAPAFYASQSGSVSWADGDNSPKTITIPIVKTASFTGVKSFNVTLTNVTGGVVVNSAAATVNIGSGGAADPGFYADFVNSNALQTIVQPDGKILLAGWMTLMQDAAFTVYTRNGFGRLNADGSVDTAFGNGSGVNATPVYAMALQADGKVLIGGSFTSVHGVTRNGLARLNTDGSLDTTFDPGAGGSSVRAIAVQADGKIVVGGTFTTFGGVASEYLARLNSDGTVDTNFVGPNFGGTSGWRVQALAIQPDNKIIVGGVFYFSGGPFSGSKFRGSLVRVTGTGAVDTTFDVGDGAHTLGNTGALQAIRAIAIQRDGSMVVGGDFTAFNSVAHNYLARVTSTGALDATFTPNADASVGAVLVQADGKILIGGQFANVNSTAMADSARLLATGVLDSNFTNVSTLGGVNEFGMQADGKIVLCADGSNGTTAARVFSGLPGLPGTVQFSAASYLGAEGTALAITATRTGGSYGAVSLNYATIAGTAAATRYTPVSGNLSWADGDSATKTITLPLLNDGIAQGDQTLSLNLGVPIGGLPNSAPWITLVTITAPYNVWKNSKFTSADLNDSSISGLTADPNHNGYSNLFEYAFGFDPKGLNASGYPISSIQTVGGSKYLTLTYRRVPGATDVIYTPQSGAVPGTWDGVPVLVGSPVSNGDGSETVTYRDSVPVNQAGVTKRFMHLQVTLSQ